MSSQLLRATKDLPTFGSCSFGYVDDRLMLGGGGGGFSTGRIAYFIPKDPVQTIFILHASWLGGSELIRSLGPHAHCSQNQVGESRGP